MDSGFWYASIDESDDHHQTVTRSEIPEQIIVPIPVITEVAYLVRKWKGTESLALFTENLSRSRLVLEVPTPADYLRCSEILRKYNDQNIDFVDACIVAMAERLDIRTILTVDRRDFSILRPLHCDSFELLPG